MNELCAITLKMLQKIKLLFCCVGLFLSFHSFSQKKRDGIYLRADKSSNNLRSEEIFVIKGDSIWYSIRRDSETVPPGERFIYMQGELIYYKNGAEGEFKNKPFYLASLMVMSCDTCPEFWKHTLKRRDSLSIETYERNVGKTDTVIKNRDTLYSTPTIVETEDPTDINRERMLFLTITKRRNLLLDNKIYRRQKRKH